MPKFPVQAPGQEPFKSATFVATFSADRNLYVAIPNLTVLVGVPRDEKSQWLARLCTILEAGFLYKESDALRSKLPMQLHHRFIPSENFPHSLEPTNYGPGCGGIWGMAKGKSLSQEGSEVLVQSLEGYVNSGRYVEAEGLAKAVVRNNAILDCDFGLFFLRLGASDVNRIKGAVEDAFKKGYFEMDWINTKNPPPEAAPNLN
jgi:hypothetical protein